ncbi:hypothetical protein [Chroococcidiopsis sp. CCALA 051]|nr:hypothetical protein [Chroococcidiopsis sp. CCALA 051]
MAYVGRGAQLCAPTTGLVSHPVENHDRRSHLYPGKKFLLKIEGEIS